MPQIGRVEINIIDEDQSRWLAFKQKELDYLNVPSDLHRPGARPDNQLKPELAAEGHAPVLVPEPEHHVHVCSTSAIP